MAERADHAAASIGRQHLKRAAGQIRQALRALDQIDHGVPPVAVVHVVRPHDLARLHDIVRDAQQIHVELDVVLYPRINPTTPTDPQE